MIIEGRFLTKNIYSRPGSIINIRGIVIHWVANPGTSAIANWNYFESLKDQPPGLPDEKYRYASAHFIIGQEGEIIQCLPEWEMAYHVGAVNYNYDNCKKLKTTYPNNCTIGIELCHPQEIDNEGKKITDDRKWIGKFSNTVLTSAIELTAILCKEHKLTINDVYRHYDITGKDCPRYFVNNPVQWENFKQNISKKLIA